MVANNQKTQYTSWYNPKDVFVFINNVELNAFQEGQMVGIAYGNDRQTMNVDAKGIGYFVGNNDRRATVTINLSELSVDNSMMAELVNSGEPFPVKVVHNGESWSGQGLVQKIPDAQFANTANGRSWNVLIPTCAYNNTNK